MLISAVVILFIVPALYLLITRRQSSGHQGTDKLVAIN